MYKVILVEDEAVVREGIANKLDWQAQGFTLTAACENGEAALAAMQEDPAHLVITDINMPKMDGLELTGAIRAAWPETLVLILTGYADFNYAQKAIRHGVQDYLLKPVTARQLREVLDKTRTFLEERAPVGEARALVERQFFSRFLSGELAAGEFEKGAAELGLALPPGPCRVLSALAVAPDANPAGVHALLKSIPGALVLPGEESRTVAILPAATSPVSVRAQLEHSGARGTSLAYSEAAPTAGDLPAAWLQTQAAEDYLYTLPPGGLAGPEALTWQICPSQSAARRAIVDAVKLNEDTRVGALLAALFAQLEAEHRRRSNAVGQLEKLVIQLGEYAEEAALPHAISAEAVLDELRQSRHITEAEAAVNAFVNSLLEAGRQQSDGAKKQAKLAVEYIKQHYHQPTLSLQDVTGYLAVSTSHFSATFKAATGFTFLEFLTRLRIEKARELLATTDLKNYEIAERVGYDDPGYFGTIFKKITGLGPAAYRKSRQ